MGLRSGFFPSRIQGSKKPWIPPDPGSATLNETHLSNTLLLLMPAQVILDLLGQSGIRRENLLHLGRKVLHDLGKTHTPHLRGEVNNVIPIPSRSEDKGGCEGGLKQKPLKKATAKKLGELVFSCFAFFRVFLLVTFTYL